MILQSLSRYYDRLASDPNEDIAPFGFSRQRIAFCVVVNPDGTLSGIEDLRKQDGKRTIPASIQVCGDSKPSGSGINPCFLWDNPTYMLGFKPEDPKPERTQEAFEAFRRKHLELEQTIQDPAFSAACRFLEQWTPESAVVHPTLVDIATGFGVFRLSGEAAYLHERPAVRNWWLTQIQPVDEGNAEAITGHCLVTGEVARLARLHEPKIKGVSGGQSAGAAIVSFNLEAFESYGKSQSYNAPVSEQAAFQYCTALNRLLTDKTRRVQIGDATVVFWTEQPSDEAEELFGFALGNSPPEDPVLADKIQKSLQAIGHGKYPSQFSDKETPFYVLGLSPNAARISVRFWHVSTLGMMTEKLRQHYADLEIIRSEKDPEFIQPWQILRETARESKEIPPLLSGALMEAILTGRPYPALLLSSLIRRIRADREIRYVRASAIKACLNRSFRSPSQSRHKELTMSLDPNREEPAYLLGRLFAELEKAQEDALPGINDTIKDRYFGAASATPGSVFPRLIRLSQHHLGKLEKPARIFREKRIQDVCDKLQNFPAHLNLKSQGLFSIGYYHQRQEMFKKKPKADSNTTNQE